MYEVAPGVHALPLTFARGDHEVTIHPAAVETPRGVLLLDVGFPGHADAIDGHLADADLGLSDVTAVAVTHQDGDHVAGLHEVEDRTGATVYAHRDAAPYVDGRRDPIKSSGDRYPPVDVDVELVDGVAFRTDAGELRVVHTPGHSPGHVSLYFPDERLLVAADALTAEGNRLQGPKPEFTPDVDEAARSVGTLAALDVDGVLCYHGGYVEAGSERIAEIRDGMG
jgi:glyoxylase-like metal-dependent hydrolase (beta-lactamase superfamily II)